MYGGRSLRHESSERDIVAAARVLRALEDDWLYARVDMMRDDEGRLVLMELELIEPYLYPEQGPDCAALFAKALARRL